MGMFDDKPNPILEEMELALQNERNKNVQMANNQMSMVMPNEDNLIRWQLDLREDMDKIYHLLKGDVVGENREGDIVYLPASDNNLKPFNDFGVQLIMNVMSFYLNRNTLLSNYDEDRIKTKVLDFGNEVSDLVLCRYMDMMMTTTFEEEFEKEFGIKCTKLNNGRYVIQIGNQYLFLSDEAVNIVNQRMAEHLHNKISFYPMLILELCDSLESALYRSLDGGERESLRTARVVNQTESMGMRQMQQQQNVPNKRFSLFKPSSWM